MPGTELLCTDRRFSTEWVMLPDGTVRPAIDRDDYLFWKVWLRLSGRYQIHDTDVAGVRVSTVFLGVDHDPGMSWKWERDEKGWPCPVYPDGYEPLIYETMIFGGDCDGQKFRARRRSQADVLHHLAVLALSEARQTRRRPRR